MNSVKLVGVFVDDFPFVDEMVAFLYWFVTSDANGELVEYSVSGSGSYIETATLPFVTPPPIPGPPPPPPVPKPTPCPPGCVPDHGKHKHKHHARYGARGVLSHLANRRMAVSSIVTDADIQAFITRNIGIGNLPQHDNETLYVLFLPDGMQVQLGADVSCQTFCGYHDSFTLSGHSVMYAVLPYPSCGGCLGTNSAFNALTGTTSHEISEAITDPVPGSGWYDDSNGEIGDICAWQFRQDGGYSVQLEWSDKQGSCI
jgi:hypothetical protein